MCGLIKIMTQFTTMARGRYITILHALQESITLEKASVSLAYRMGRNARNAQPIFDAWQARVKELDSPEYNAYVEAAKTSSDLEALDSEYRVVLDDRKALVASFEAYANEDIEVYILPIPVADLPKSIDRQLVIEALDFISE